MTAHTKEPPEKTDTPQTNTILSAVCVGLEQFGKGKIYAEDLRALMVHEFGKVAAIERENNRHNMILGGLSLSGLNPEAIGDVVKWARAAAEETRARVDAFSDDEECITPPSWLPELEKSLSKL